VSPTRHGVPFGGTRQGRDKNRENNPMQSNVDPLPANKIGEGLRGTPPLLFPPFRHEGDESGERRRRLAPARVI